ncbi:MAG: serine/threonine protein kinase [Planctomycetes bacterium]|nr:serine/threonine protein kinase [Planctomycetota bacterium]
MKIPPEVTQASQSAHLGGFVKIMKVGVGSMGEVYKAWDLKEGRWVALKILRSNDTVQLARFIREAQVAQSMKHPNITTIYDAGKDKGQWYIAMQFVAGHSLKAFPRTSRRISVELIRDAARALDLAHSKGIVHRDLKPENFMVQSKPREGENAKSIEGCDHHIFVMDFGIARPSDANTQLTIPGTVMGSPSFMSPEQASGQQVDLRTDIYALGATLYDRLLGRPPFESKKNIFEALRLVQETMPTRPRVLDSSIDPKLDSIVMKTLEKSPANRYQTAGELADALDGWLKDNQPAAEVAQVAPAKKAGCGKAALWLIAVGIAGAALVSVLA